MKTKRVIFDFLGRNRKLQRSRRLPKVEMGNVDFMSDEEPRSPMCVAGIIPVNYHTIFFNPKMPKIRYDKVEEDVEYILLHENIHQLVAALEGWFTTRHFDDLFHSYEERIQFCREVCT